MKILLAAVPLALSAALLTAPAAQADSVTCSGTIRAVSIDGDVIVPKGATCSLIGTRVDGNVQVKEKARLYARGVVVGGNVQADNHRVVEVTSRVVNGVERRSRVGGSIQAKQGGGGKLVRTITGSDIQLFSNDGAFTVSRNRVDGNLQCKSNTPAPTGSGNVVEGNKEDQCAKL